MTFDTILMIDWSGGNAKGHKPCADAIWACVARDGAVDTPVYFRSRQAFEPWLIEQVERELTMGRRTMLGFDFAFGVPVPASRIITQSDDPLALWSWLDQQIEDGLKHNNRFDVAAQINTCFEGIGPFWGNGLKRDIAHLPRKGTARDGHNMPERRAVEARAPGTFSVWQLSGVGAVGSQVLMGLPVLNRLRRRFSRHVAVWPFEPPGGSVTLVEIWPSLFKDRFKQEKYHSWIKDAAQMHMMAEWAAQLDGKTCQRLLSVPPTSEGWIFGVSA